MSVAPSTLTSLLSMASMVSVAAMTLTRTLGFFTPKPSQPAKPVSTPQKSVVPPTGIPSTPVTTVKAREIPFDTTVMSKRQANQICVLAMLEDVKSDNFDHILV